MSGLRVTGVDSSAVIERLLEHCRSKEYKAKEVIVHQGDPSEELLYIVSGSVSVMLEDAEGNEIVVAYLNAGSFVGEMGLFDENASRTALVRARSTSRIAQIGYTRLQSLEDLFPEILVLIASQMAARLRRTTRKVGDLAFLDVSGRVARTLLDLCKEPDAMTHPDGMQIRITRQELGRIVGCSREMVGRVLKLLEAQDLISVSGKTFVVFGVRHPAPESN